MSSRSSGVASLGERADRLVGGRQRARRRAQLLGGRAEQRRVALEPRHRVGRLAERARQLADGVRHVRLLGRELAHHDGRRVDQAGEVVAARGELRVELVQRRDQVPQVLPPLGDRGVHAREVAVRRLEPPQHLAQVQPAAFEPAPGVADQQLQVVARVGVELGEDLVRVDVRRGRGDRDRVAGLRGRRAVGPRLEVDEHVLQAGPGPQQRAGVGADHPLVLGVDHHLDDGLAVAQLDGADVADPHAGHAHGLALARDHGLGGRELGVQPQRRGLPREAHALLVEQVQRHAGGDDDQAEDGEDLLRVLADRGHRPAPVCAAILSISCGVASSPAIFSLSSRPSTFSWCSSHLIAFVRASA